MSKLSFRARHLDPSKQMPIYLAEELPDLPEYSAINRAVPQMPSGMEKEEESEHHLQRAICTGLIIPTPEVLQTDQPFYDTYYPPDYKMPRQMIHMQPLGLDTEVPDYDMDKADMEWLNQQERLELTELKFEQLMDLLEKSSGQTVVTLNEAKSLLNQDDETSISLYDYWLNKRLKMQHPLILTVKTESRPGASSNNPYLAFRRRTEKMQTRKNRKNDEASYEKMLKLRRDLQRATTILEMVRRREETKREQLKTTVNIFEKRVEMRDFNGAVYSELNAQYKSTRPAYNSVYANQYSQGAAAAVGTGGAILAALPPGLLSGGGAAGNTNVYGSPSQYLNTSTMDTIHSGSGNGNGSSSRKEKRPYKKRKHKLPRDKQQNQHQQLQQQQQQQQQTQQYLPGQSPGSGASPAHHLPHHLHNRQLSASPAANDSLLDSEEDDYLNGGVNGTQLGSESEEEAPFAFRRKPSCIYLPTRHRNGRWPYDSADEETEASRSAGPYSDPKYRYTLTSINYPRPRCIGFARRRVGRGGRILLDRAITNFDDVWSQLDYTVMESVVKSNNHAQRKNNQLKPDVLPVAKPCSPPTVVDLVVVPSSKPMDTDETSLPLDIVKSEPSSHQADKPIASSGTVGDSLLPLPQEKEVDEVLELELDGEEDDLATDDENVSRLSYYSSAVTLHQNSYDMRLKRRRLRHKKQQMRELNAAKRLKRSSEAATGGHAAEAAAGEEDSRSASLGPLPRAYLQRLVLALGQKLKQQQEEEMETCENLAPQEEKSSAAEELLQQPTPTRANNQHHPHHRSNNNNNTVLNNNNSSSSSSRSNMNKDVSISEKINVIKLEAEGNENVGQEEQPVASTSAAAAAARAVEAAAAAEAASSGSMLGPSMEDVAKTIKRELIDADDSNEPLSSIRTATAAATVLQATTSDPELMDDEAEDDVNLAQLSSIIRHTAVKKELEAQQQQQQLQQQEQREYPQQELKEETVCLNQLPDVIRLQNLRNSQMYSKPRDLYIHAPAEELDGDYLGGLSPTSSQRLDICNELLSEIRRDWLHFRPKTPTDELSDSNDGEGKPCSGHSDVHAVDWTQDTPISVELNRLVKREEIESGTSTYFLSNAFKYTDLDSDAQLIQTAYAQDYARGTSKSPNCSGSGSGSALEFNLSAGDSLNDINNLLGDDEDDNHEHMLDNILQECAMDDPKALNQATSFWNGILDGEAAVDEVEMADQLLDCIDEKKPKMGGEPSKRAGRPRKPRPANVPIGSSSFTVCPTQESLKDREVFFSQEVVTPKEEPPQEAEPAAPVPATTTTATTATTTPPDTLESVKVELAVETSQPEVALPPTVQLQPTPPPQSQSQPQLQSQSMPQPIVATPTPQLINIPAQITPQKPQMAQIQTQVQTQQLQLPSQTQAQVQTPTGPQVTQLLNQFANASPQIIARTEYGGGAAVGDIVTITPHTGSSPLPTLSAQQQLQHQLAQAQLRNVTVQQRQGTPQQVQVQQQQPTQQLLFQMQRDGIGSPVITTQSIVTSSRSLTPLNASGAGAAGNHMIYTTGSGEIITAAAAAAAQKVTYAIQKTSGAGGATTTSIGPNTVITLSNVKLQSDDNCSAGGVGSGSGSSVNIINTASGQQLAVHSIAGMQQHQQQQQGTTTTPLIVTTPNRNNVQQHSQQQLVQQQPIVWRQVSGTNTAVATTAVLSTTADTSPAAVGNKILWTSRATQKRQLNGPENSDINKLLLNRKFSQRKVIGQHPGGQQLQQQPQQQIQLTKQQLQQLVQHEDDLVAATTAINSGDQMDTGESLQQQQHHQHQQLQKLSKVIKMSPFPLLVSDLNLQQQPQQQLPGQHTGQSQQQQQQQLKPNSAAAIAANHNYSLISSHVAPQQANKIFLTSSNSGGGGNFTIATASELQAAAAAVSNAGGQKLHYKELTNSNLKLNFVSSTGEALASQAPQQVGATTVVLNKAQQQQVPHQKLKTVSAANAQQVQQGDKRVLYTSLLNVKPLQKNNSGQMQMQLGPGGLQQVLRGRLNNSAIITRALPLGTTVNSSGGVGAGGTPTTIRQLVTTNANNVGSSDGALINAKDVGKSLTVEQVIASANNGGVVIPTSNNNNNNGGGTGSGGGGGGAGGVSGGGGVTVTTSSNVNVPGAGGAGVTSTINR